MRLSVSPNLRAALLAFHVVAVLALSLPRGQSPHSKRWESPLMQRDLADWARQLQALGVTMTTEQLKDWAKRFNAAYMELRERLLWPFELYAEVTGARQGWAMFASPQRHPFELHVDALARGEWRPLYRPHDPNAAFMSDFFSHNRIRKFRGRFARVMKGRAYEQFAAFIARRAFEHDASVERVRVRLYAYASLPPERVRVGERPQGTYHHERTFSREEL